MYSHNIIDQLTHWYVDTTQFERLGYLAVTITTEMFNLHAVDKPIVRVLRIRSICI